MTAVEPRLHTPARPGAGRVPDPVTAPPRGQSVAPDWILVAAAKSATNDRPVGRRRVFLQVIAVALIVILGVTVAGVFAARRLAETQAVNDAAKTADLLGNTVVQPALDDGLLTGDPAALAAIDRVVRNLVLGGSIVRVKIWDPTGRIVYSDEPRLIGRTFPLGAEERDVLTNPKLRADVSDLQALENVYEKSNVRLLEAYRPVWTTRSGKPLLFEAYFRYDEVTARSGQLWRGFAGITLSSILLLVVLLVPVLWRLLDRLRRFQDQREALLVRAVEASNEERRRIAGTLHDGVVQDLVATSLVVAGSAERAAVRHEDMLADELRSAAGTVRSAIGGLRSLLVDIYPQSLSTAGLGAALEDLVAGLRSRGIAVCLEDNLGGTLEPDVERLLFRVANECLRNIVRHSGALHATVRLERMQGSAVLEISDDGVGFDPQSALAEPAEGHFGLRVLGDVANDAGAELRLATAPGAGTRWRLQVPTS